MGEYEQAITWNQKAAEIKSTPELLNNMGLAYQGQERYADALKYFNEAIDLYNKEWPDQHYAIGTTLDNIGQSYNTQGE